jgi:hypothetical protein
LDALKCGGWGVFIAPTTKMTVGGGCCRMVHRTVRCATRHCPVRQPRHQIVGFRPLELLTTGPPDSPVVHRTVTVHYPVRLLVPALTSAHADAHCSVSLFLCRRPLARTTVAPLGTPDSPVNYSGAASLNSRRWQVWSGTPWCIGHCPVAHRTVRCARPGLPLGCLLLFLFEPFLGLFIGLC